MFTLDFSKILIDNKPSKVLCGAYNGIKARNGINIEKIFDDNNIVYFIIPDDIFAINPSFLEEFLKLVILKYQYSIFDRIVLCETNTYDVYPVLQEIVNRILIIKNLC